MAYKEILKARDKRKQLGTLQERAMKKGNEYGRMSGRTELKRSIRTRKFDDAEEA